MKSTCVVVEVLPIKDYSKELIFSETGWETVKLCSQRKDIDIILMDIQMPDLNGYKAKEEVSPPGIPLLY